jgi:hypothetical protein
MAGGRRSPQVQSVYDQYGVRTMPELLRAVRDEYALETGEPFTLRDADLMLDGMFEAEFQKIEGGAYDRCSDCGSPLPGNGHDDGVECPVLRRLC